MYSIYSITHIATGKMYIGMTKTSVRKRFNSHYRKAKYNHKNNQCLSCLHAMLLSEGKKAFNWAALESDIQTAVEAGVREAYYIAFYNTQETGYNIAKGGLRPGVATSSRHKIKDKLIGRKFSQDTIEKMKAAAKLRHAKYEAAYKKAADRNVYKAEPIIAVTQSDSTWYRSVNVAVAGKVGSRSELYTAISTGRLYKGKRWMYVKEFVNGAN